MPSSCCAIGCANRYNKGKEIRLYLFPRDEERLAKWIKAIRRKNWQPNQHSRICSSHFISGRPSYEESNPDYVPSIFVYSKRSKQDSLSSIARYKRLLNRHSVTVEESDIVTGTVLVRKV